jgi:hypothetical protein
MALTRIIQAGILFICLFWPGAMAAVGYPLSPESSVSAKQSFRIQFKGYNQLGGAYVFQFHFDNFPANQQPPLKATGDPLGYGGYVVGDFHQAFVVKVDAASQTKMAIDQSTVELIQPNSGLRIIVPFRRMVDLPK